MQKSGIYGIINKHNGRLYVGQSCNLERRKSEHFSELTRGVHCNVYLQNSYNKYGADCFDFVVLENCEIEELPLKELAWINRFSREMLYNHVIDVQYRSGTSNPNFGNRNTPEVKALMSENRGKIKTPTVLAIADMLRDGVKHQDIADKFKISRTVVTRIANGSRWSNITGGAVQPVVRRENKIVRSERYLSHFKRPRSEETKRRIAQAITGRKRSEETKRKISEAKRKKEK